MTWTCPHCGARYPDDAPRRDVDGEPGCRSCTEIVRATDTDMTAVAAEIADGHVALKEGLLELADRLEDGDAPDQWFADELRSVLAEH